MTCCYCVVSVQELQWDNPMPHEVWSKDELESVQLTHVPAKDLTDKVSYGLSQIVRFVFDKATGYKHEGRLSPAVWLRRLIFLETIAGVPGMVRALSASRLSLFSF